MEASTLQASQLQVTDGGTEVEGEAGGGGNNAAVTSMTVSNKSPLAINAQLYAGHRTWSSQPPCEGGTVGPRTDADTGRL